MKPNRSPNGIKLDSNKNAPINMSNQSPTIYGRSEFRNKATELTISDLDDKRSPKSNKRVKRSERSANGKLSCENKFRGSF